MNLEINDIIATKPAGVNIGLVVDGLTFDDIVCNSITANIGDIDALSAVTISATGPISTTSTMSNTGMTSTGPISTTSTMSNTGMTSTGPISTTSTMSNTGMTSTGPINTPILNVDILNINVPAPNGVVTINQATSPTSVVDGIAIQVNNSNRLVIGYSQQDTESFIQSTSRLIMEAGSGESVVLDAFSMSINNVNEVINASPQGSFRLNGGRLANSSVAGQWFSNSAINDINLRPVNNFNSVQIGASAAAGLTVSQNTSTFRTRLLVEGYSYNFTYNALPNLSPTTLPATVFVPAVNGVPIVNISTDFTQDPDNAGVIYNGLIPKYFRISYHTSLSVQVIANPSVIATSLSDASGAIIQGSINDAPALNVSVPVNHSADIITQLTPGQEVYISLYSTEPRDITLRWWGITINELFIS